MTPGTILTISLESEQNSVSQAGTERLTCHLNEETRGGGCRIWLLCVIVFQVSLLYGQLKIGVGLVLL